jgi:hypothetical protein
MKTELESKLTEKDQAILADAALCQRINDVIKWAHTTAVATLLRRAEDWPDEEMLDDRLTLFDDALCFHGFIKESANRLARYVEYGEPSEACIFELVLRYFDKAFADWEEGRESCKDLLRRAYELGEPVDCHLILDLRRREVLDAIRRIKAAPKKAAVAEQPTEAIGGE